MIELPSPCLVVLVGAAASGKSTWAARYFSGHVVASDEFRRLVGEGPDDLRASSDAFAVLDDVVGRRLRRGLTTVIDSLGTDAARRAAWRTLAARYGVSCVAVVFDVPAAQVRRQNRERPDRVPEAVLRRQLAEWPHVVQAVRDEHFDAVHLVAEASLVPPALVRPRHTRAAVETAAAPSPRRLAFGLQIPRFTWPGGPAELGPRLRSIAVAAERVGFESLWVMDHFRQIPLMGPAWHDMLESWTTLSHLAAATERIHLGTLVTGITYRNVAHLGKIVATLDVLSGGRALCGVGLAWFADEHRAYGWDFPDRNARYALLEDALQLLPRLWGPGNKPFTGQVLDVPDTTCYPRPLQAHVPILVGGSGERRTLRLVARYADACNLFGEPDVIRRKVAVLHDHCVAAGRDPASVSVTQLSTVLVGDHVAHVRELVDATRPPRVGAERYARSVNAGTAEQHLDRIGRLAAAGVDHVIVSLADLCDAEAVERFGQVIAAVS